MILKFGYLFILIFQGDPGPPGLSGEVGAPGPRVCK